MLELAEVTNVWRALPAQIAGTLRMEAGPVVPLSQAGMSWRWARLCQLDDLFGDQLRDPDRRFELEIALRLRQMLRRRRP